MYMHLSYLYISCMVHVMYHFLYNVQFFGQSAKFDVSFIPSGSCISLILDG